MKKNRLFAAAASMAMIASVMSVVPMGAGAANDAYTKTESGVTSTDWTSDSKNTTMLKKVFEIEDNSNIPAASFTFKTTAGTARTATNNTLAVLAGVDPDKIKYKTVASTDHLNFADSGSTAITASTVSGTSSEIVVSYAANNVALGASNAVTGSTLTNTSDNVVLSDGNTGTYYAEKEVELDFSDCVFTEPGVYRYLINETNSHQSGITYDSSVKVLDVYVEDDGVDGAQNQLKITGYVMYTAAAEPATGPSNAETAGSTTTSQKLEDNSTVNANDLRVAGATKSVGFKNSYDTSEITFGKEVTGNQGSKDKYFDFTVVLDHVTAGTVFNVDLSKADSAIAANPNAATTIAALSAAYSQVDTIIAGGTPTTYTVEDSATTGFKKVTVHYYLQDGQYITIKGVAKDTTYAITEAAEDYTPTEKISASLSTLNWDGTDGYDLLNDNVRGTIASADIHTGYTNDRSGTIPTGILLSVAGPAVVGAVTLGGIQPC